MRPAAIRTALIMLAFASTPAGALETYKVVGDAIPAPLGGKIGDPERGRALVLDRTQGNCLICHRVPEPNEPFQGTIGPDLAGVGTRLDAGQLRLRLVDASLLGDGLCRRGIVPGEHHDVPYPYLVERCDQPDRFRTDAVGQRDQAYRPRVRSRDYHGVCPLQGLLEPLPRFARQRARPLLCRRWLEHPDSLPIDSRLRTGGRHGLEPGRRG